MVCPGCGAPDSKVVKTMKSRVNYRQRQCPCGIEWSTSEVITKGSLRTIHGTFREQVPPAVVADVLARDGNKCRYCESLNQKLGVDHVIPLCAPIPEGKTRAEETAYRNSIDNLVACCPRCNSKKRDTVNGKRVGRGYSSGQVPTNSHGSRQDATHNDLSRPIMVRGDGGGLPSGLSGSDPNLLSGPSQPPDLQGDRPPARETDPDPNDIRLPSGEVTGWNLAKVFGRVRGRDCPGGFGWTIPKSSPDKAEGIVTEANADPSARADIVPTMALLFAKAKAGKLGAGTDMADPTVAFGWWVSKFTKLREELHRAPTAAAPNGFARSEYPEVRR